MSEDEREAELRYLRRALDESGADIVALNARVVALRTELEVRRRGFSLLARLGGSIGARTEVEPAIASVLPIVESELQVQRTLALRRDGGRWAPFAWTGYGVAEAGQLERARLELPFEGVVATRETVDPWVEELRSAAGFRTFVSAPVPGHDHLLVAARIGDHGGFFPRFERADLDTLYAVTDLVAASVENSRLAALSEARRFLSPALVEELVKGTLATQPAHERREVTLLAVDMVGSTPLAEKVSPEALADLLNAYLREMTTLAHAHGGTVGSLAGDGVLLIFGAPEAMAPEEHAWAAARTAFAMLTRMEAVAEETGEDVRIRIGLNTGVASVGVYGSDTQRTYTAMGLPVHLAARLESAAAPGEVLASQSTLALIEGRVRAIERERLMLKGMAEPVAAYALEPA